MKFAHEESEYIKAQVQKAHCWGFIEDNKLIHLYKTKNCKQRDLIELFAHELSHEGEDILKQKHGESFATMNAALCVRAYDLAKELT